MDWRAGLRKVYSAEGAFCLGGLLFIGMAFAFDLSQHLIYVGEEVGHVHGGGNVFLRVNIPVMGIALIAFGLGMFILNERRDQVSLLAYVAGLLILTDGIAHLFAISDHINVPLYVAGFAATAVIQVGGGVLMPFLPRRWDRYWIVLTIALIAIYAASRSFSLPPLWQREPLDSLGIFSKSIEVVALFPLVELVKRRQSLPVAATASRAVEP